MRELKFRIWDEKEKKMIYLDHDKESPTMQEFLKANKEGLLMLYTGLKDTKGSMIYEGDYLKIYNTYKEKTFEGRVKYLSQAAEFVIESENLTRHKRWINYEMTIVGNCYKNPGYLVLNDDD